MTAPPELRSKARRLILDMVNSPLHFMAGWQIGVVNTGRPRSHRSTTVGSFLSGWIALLSAYLYANEERFLCGIRNWART
jgi:hypothetical protein